ncbi:MAG: hypothetical protein J6M37_05925 [Prevotella sp.]|nr:hypothetical protein [Prevotella sp.]
MRKEFFIPQRVVANKSGYEYLSSLYEEMEKCNCDELQVLFKNCMFFDANLSAALGAFFDRQSAKGIIIFLSAPDSPGVKRALSRNKFFEAFSVETKYEDRENYINYRRFGVSDTIAFKEYIKQELIQKERFPKCTEKAKGKIIESIYEIFANAVSHGGCDFVYCCGEVHTREGRTMLDITFVDLGRTVVDNVNNFMVARGQAKMSSCDTLDWAFVEGNTTKSLPGGLGLAILKQFIGMNEGTIQMISGDAMLEIIGQNPSSTKLDRWFPGTIVTVEFNCDDDKTYLMTDEIPNKNNLF